MAFCRFCGNQIPDGTVCTCQQNTAPQTIPPQPQPPAGGEQASEIVSRAGTAAKNAFNSFIPYLKAFIKSPSETVYNAVLNNSFNISFGFVIINALTLIITIWSLIGSLVSLANNATGLIGADLGISPPVFRMIFGGILMSAVAITLSAVTLIIFSKLGKVALSFKQAFIIASFRSFWPSVLILGGTLIALIGGIFGFIIALLAVSFATQMITFTAINDIRDYSGCQPSSTGKTFLVPLVYAIAYGVVTVAVIMIFSWCLGGIEMEGLSGIMDLLNF